MTDDLPPDDLELDIVMVRSKSLRRRLAKQQALPTYGETPEQTQKRRTQRIKQLAQTLGFSRLGVARAQALPHDLAHMQAWLQAGMHGAMGWLAQDVEKRCDPQQLVPGAQSVIALALDYNTQQPHTQHLDLQGEDRAWISRYAWGADYHVILERKLKALTDAVRDEFRVELGEQFRGDLAIAGPFKAVKDFRWYVDYGPILERTWAEKAGLGWRGKHSLLIHPQNGSFFFLACIVTSIALDVDEPILDHCGSCTACLDACPTQAIVEPFVVDARLCISHTTIENTSEIPDAERHLVGDMLFGCDICQDVCPWNRFSSPTVEPQFSPRAGNFAPKLSDILTMDQAQFAMQFAQSAVKRRGLAGLQDNARAVLESRATKK